MLVSVILTSYNHEKYLHDAINSILNQTFKDFELIISDDCSNDSSWKIINSYTDPRIIKIRHEKNLRKQLFPKLIDSLKGKYVAIHHSDDVWESTKLEKQVKFLETHPEYAACFTLVNFIDEDGNQFEAPIGNFYRNVFEKKNRSKEEWLRHFFFHGNCLCHPSLLIRKDMYDKYNLYAPWGIYQIPDFLLWIKLCLHEEIYIYQEKLTFFRLHVKKRINTSGDRVDVNIRSQIETYALLEEYKKINNKDMFFKIFPEGKEFIRNNYFNIYFALARIAIKTNIPVYMLFGVNLLYLLINGKERYDIERNYNYNYKNFFQETGKLDIFNLRSSFHYLSTTIYIDYGTGFNEKNKINKKIYIPQDDSFYVEYILEEKDKIIKSMRFDPDENRFLKIAIKDVFINNQRININPVNAYNKFDEYDIFYTFDPQYILNYCGNGEVTIKIEGKLDFQYDINSKFNNFYDEYQKLNDKYNNIINSRKYIILNRISNSFAYKILNRIRKIFI